MARAITRAATLVLLVVSATLAAQEPFMWRGRGRRVPPRFPTAESFDGRFNFCRLMFSSQWREPGGSGWNTDYPGADLNFPIRLGELSKVRVSRQPSGDANHLVVRPTDPFLFQCPFVLASDIGTAFFEPQEAEALRAYLEKGGFLWVDDFWGDRAWAVWVGEIGKVLSPGEYPIEDVPPNHPLWRTLFEVRALPQIPSISHWRRSGGETSERGLESAEPDIKAIHDRHGRIMVLMTHDTDISDSWEREGEEPEFFYQFSPNGYALAINAVVYAMTH
ncbi:MAG: DUF4159 domain-containing protein [Acidobacteriota bacterium]|nr:DUF4159 domain-containing protein [Acidobacteriota bacterium]